MAFDLNIQVSGGEQVQLGFSRFAESIKDWSPVFQDIAADFHEMERRQFDSEGGYASGGWKPLSKTYAEWKAKNYPGNKILVLSGLMKESLTDNNPWTIEDIQALQAEFGTRIPWAIYHQNGGRKIPQRQIVFLTQADQTRWIKLIHAWLLKESNKAFAGLMPTIGEGQARIKSIQSE